MTERDVVDDIVDAWRRERPDLDLAPLHVLSRVLRIARRLEKARSAAFSTASLESWEWDVLSALRRSGAPYTLAPKALLVQTGVSSGTMTNRVDRLVERGLVERHVDPADRRGVRVVLTPVGLGRTDAALSALLDAEADLLRGLDGADRDDIAGLLRRLGNGLAGA